MAMTLTKTQYMIGFSQKALEDKSPFLHYYNLRYAETDSSFWYQIKAALARILGLRYERKIKYAVEVREYFELVPEWSRLTMVHLVLPSDTGIPDWTLARQAAVRTIRGLGMGDPDLDYFDDDDQ